MIGMSVNDFCGLTPDEFREIADAWHETRKERWEQVRTLAAFGIAPWNSKKKRIEDLMPMPWDNKRETKAELTAKEKQRRYEEALRQRGLKTIGEAPSANASGTEAKIRSDDCD